MKSTAIALLFFCLFIACKNQNSGTVTTDTTTTATPPMDSIVTDAGSSLGNYPVSSEPSIGTYDTIAAYFKGKPTTDTVKQLMDIVLKQCNMEVTRDNVMHFANELEVSRKNSKSGKTEIDILKEMYQHGTSKDIAIRLRTATSWNKRIKVPHTCSIFTSFIP